MSSPLTSLHFHKINDRSCTILMYLQNRNHELGEDLQSKPSEIPSTVLAFLLEILEKNQILTELQLKLQNDTNLNESLRSFSGKLFSNYFINPQIVMKYVESARITRIQEAYLYADTVQDFGFSEAEEELFWENILQKTQHDFYLPDETDFNDLAEMPRYCGCMNILENLEILETFLPAKQIEKLLPCIEFELIFTENYLQEIDFQASAESCLDTTISQWLDKI